MDKDYRISDNDWKSILLMIRTLSNEMLEQAKTAIEYEQERRKEDI